MFPQFALLKAVASIAAGVGTSKIVRDVVLNNVTINTTADAAKVWIGRVVLQGIVADAAFKYVGTQFDAAELMVLKAQRIVEAKNEEDSVKEAEGS